MQDLLGASGEAFAPALTWYQSPDTSDRERWNWLLEGDMHSMSAEAAKQKGEMYTEEQSELYTLLRHRSMRGYITRAVQHFLQLAMRERDRVCGGLRMVLVRSGEASDRPLQVIRDDGPQPARSTSRPARRSSTTSREEKSLPIGVALLQCQTGRSAERKRYACAGSEPLALSRYSVVRMEC